jgi:two-component system response regulator NreC
MAKIRVLIADDHAIVREGLKQLINSQQDIEIVGEAEDGMEALEKIRALRPDVVLLDIAMPRLNGLEAISLIKEAVSSVQIVVLSMHTKENYVHQALATGALGYVLKASPGAEVVKAIRAAHQGEYFLSSKIKAEVIGTYLKNRKRQPEIRGYDTLSERERQVFRLVVEGNSNKQIGDLLCVSPKTVEKHRSNVMKKLGINDFLGMVKYAVKLGIADPELWGE